MDPRTFTYLKRIHMFRDMPDEVVAQIAGQVEIVKLNKGDILIRKGDFSDSLFIIRSGWVKIVTAGPGDKELILNQLGPGQFTGETSLIDRQPHEATVVALSPVQVFRIRYDVFLTLLERYPQLLRTFLGLLFERLRFANLYIERAIEWSSYVAEGDYGAVQKQIKTTQSSIIDMSQASELRINAFLSALFDMIESVKEREDSLKRQLQAFEIEIDESEQERAVSDLIKGSFFMRVQSVADRLRGQRNESEENE